MLTPTTALIALSAAGLQDKVLALFASIAGLVVLWLVLVRMEGGLTLKRLVGAVFLALAAVATVGASPQLAAEAWNYGQTSMTSDLKALFADPATGNQAEG
jgi:hypothetical protein